MKSSNLGNKPFAFSDYFHHRLREGILLVIAIVSLFLLLALLTHTSADPIWQKVRNVHAVINLGGRAGAFLADFLLYLFGYLAYLLPFILFYGTWLYFRYYYLLEEDNYLSYFISLRVAGFILMFVPGCALASLHWYLDPPRLSGGGLLGQWVAVGMVSIFNIQGSSIILGGLYLTGLTLFTGLSWVKLADFLGSCLLYCTTTFRNFIFRLDDWVIQSTDDEKDDLIISEDTVTESSKISKKSSTVKLNKRLEPKIDFKNLEESPSTLLDGEPFIGDLGTRNPSCDTTIFPSTPSVLPIIKTLISNHLKPLTELKSFEKSLPIYKIPSISLLDLPDKTQIKGYNNQELESISKEVELRLQDFGIIVKVVAVYPGPIVTRFELQLAAGTKVSRITTLAKDLARSLSVISVRVVEIIPGKSVIGLELPNTNREIVRLREILSSNAYETNTATLALAMGKDIAGNPIIIDLAKMPHLLVAGTTGSGKSVGLNAMLLSLLFKASPEKLRLILIDPKLLELSIYEGIPHLLTPVVTDMKKAANALRWCVYEMNRRYRLMAALGVRNLAGFNAKIKAGLENNTPILDPFQPINASTKAEQLIELPYIVVLVDEFAEMMMEVGKKVEELIVRIAQKARAAGIHLILATQRPSVDVITGLIKANIPTRMAFQMSSRLDSRIILDQQGAEQLLGYGDMLYLPSGTGVPIRVHVAFVADEEVHRIVSAIKKRTKPQYISDILEGRVDVEESTDK